MQLRKTLLSTLVGAACSVGAIASASAQALSLDALRNPSNFSTQTSEQEDPRSTLRLEIIREAATALGLRAGAAHQARKILADLESRSETLDRLYRFSVLFTASGVYIPPVIEVVKNRVSTDGSVMRKLDEGIRIIKRGRLALNPPNWREYLYVGLDVTDPPIPAQAALPREGNELELKIWEQEVSKGWALGVEQANETYKINHARLNRDYEGMLQYSSMKERGLMTDEVIAGTYVPVSGDENSLNLNEQIYQVTQQPKMVTDHSKHKPIVKSGGAQ
jgi:defect-in-organelle-trafficking protein DotC